MDWLLVDVETTGLDPRTDEIIEISAIRWRDGAAEQRFSSLVKPRHALPPQIRQLTGLTDDDLRAAPKLADIWPEFRAFAADAAFVAHHASFDLAFLRRVAENLDAWDLRLDDAADTLVLSRILLPGLTDYSLEALAHHLALPTRPMHRAAADVQVLLELWQKLGVIAETLPVHTLEQLAHVGARISPATATWFRERADVRRLHHGDALPAHAQRVDAIVFRAPDEPTPSRDEVQHRVDASEALPAEAWLRLVDQYFGDDSPIRRVIPSYRSRPGQQQMAIAVAHALQQGHHLVAEAGTGTGKSLAYLIPAALHAKQTGTRVVVATHTIALQDQLRDRDVPVLQQVMGDDVTIALFKGRNHYVCMRKVQSEVHQVDLTTSAEQAEAIMAVLRWLVDTAEGIRDELAPRGAASALWQRIQSESETCIGRRCPFFKPCYYFRARAKAQSADVVITNHSLVLSDIRADHRVLPKYDQLILDEAHHLEQAATDHLGESVEAARVHSTLGRLVREGRTPGLLADMETVFSGHRDAVKLLPVLQTLRQTVSELRPAMDHAFACAHALLPKDGTPRRFDEKLSMDPAWSAFVEAVQKVAIYGERIRAEVERLESILGSWGDDDDASDGRVFDAAGLLREVSNHVDILVRALEPSDAWVAWVEQPGPDLRALAIRRAPLDIAEILRDSLFATKRAVILTSATLSVGGEFRYVTKSLGLTALDKPVNTITVASPFALERQAMLCVPNDVPDLSAQEAGDTAAWLAEALADLADASGGRLLVLFTSHALLRAVAASLRGRLRAMGMRLYAQGMDGERSRLLSAFRAHPRSVLLGAQSFWEGIDLPGDQLRALAIVRLPFTPPTHPVTQARAELVTRSGQNAFWTLSLPEAVVRFRQGFGRLIRTVDDRGVVIVYDKRIMTARYGAVFVKSLPGVRPVIDTHAALMDRVRAFLQTHPASH
ncbi:MAG: DEAD/DEAH box helicase [Thermoflavifilum sp.]|nr:DEAD/DEAH box helicase [Thermoflavifilum sp.]MCL6513933.1 DEAD/DEAH box helicase [Alicyclobacillus sp.]